MNKVFKVIWSEARNAYVVVSEMAKNHGTKSCSAKKLLAMLIATGVMTCASVAPVMAANPAPTDTKIEVGKDANAKGGDSVAIGNGAEAKAANGIAIGHTSLSEGSGAIAIGKSTNAKGAASLAFGNDAKALAEASIAFGQDSKSSGNSSIAIGRQANATGQNSIAIGSQAVADKAYSVVIGAHTYKGTTGTNVTGVGQQAQVLGDYSTAFGMAAQANKSFTSAIGSYAKATADNANAMGSYSTASADFSVALGTLSVADRTGGYVGLYAPEDTNSLTWIANGGAVSVGSNGSLTRQIINVAAGTEDTDAVNVAQLKAATENTGWHLSAEEEITGDINSRTKINHGDTVHFQGTDDNITISKEETEDATVMHVALSKNLVIDSVQAGDYFMDSNMGIGFGGDAYITQNGLDANNNVISNVAAGVYNTDAVNVGQLKEVEEVAANANKGWNLSTNGVATEATNVAPGEYVDFSGDKNISVSHDGTKVKAELNKDLVDIESISNGDAKLTLGGLATELTNGQGASVKLFGEATIINGKVNVYNDGRISGVAAGINDTDAVNVSQLKAVGTTANMGWNLATNGVATEATNVKPGDFVDFSGDKNISVSHDGTKVQVELNKDIDVNSVQTNALTSKYNLSVGTMAENGIMPFFVNSTGDFYAAHNKFHVDKDGKVTATAGEIGNVVLQNGVYYGHSTLQDGSLLLTDDNGNHSYIDAKGAKLGKVTVAEDGKITGVAAGAVTADSTDAVNGSQLHAVATEASKHSKVVNGSNINVEEFDNDGQKIYKVNLNKDIMLGDLTGKYVNISGTNGTIETTGYIATNDRVYADKGGKLADIDVTGDKISNGASSIVLDGSNVKVNDKVTIDQNGKISGVAAGEVSSTSTDAINGSQLHQTNENVAQNKADIAQNKADIAQNKADIAQNKADIAQNKADIAQNKADIATNKANIEKNANDIATNKQNIDKLNTRVDGVEKLAKQHTTVTAGDNITVTEGLNADGGKEYNVAMNKDINLDSVTTGQTVMNNDGLKVGDKVSVTATAVTAGKTSISDEGVKVGDKTYISDKGLNANDQKVTNVAAGEISATSKDAVNGSQLYATNQEVVNNTNRINKLGSRVNKVGAGAAALAALHPMDFDPDDKLTFSAGYGNYAGENAAAIGAYYRPDEKVMFSVAGTVGNGENMVNAGVSFALDRTNHVSNSRTALAREVIDLRGQLAVMGAKMAKMEKAFGMLDETKTKLFPDVPANHWAYEYIAKLAGNGYIEGYPDGNFGGDRLMTRYEFAAMLYRAIENGAALEEKIIKEFEPELGRIRVERISGEDGDRDKIERVRVNDTKGERDHYGNKLAK